MSGGRKQRAGGGAGDGRGGNGGGRGVRGLRRRWWLLVIAAILLLLLTFWWRSTGEEPASGERISLSAPPAAGTEPEPELADFVGAARCRDCHAEQYAAWQGSTHGRAGGEPTADVVIAPFDGRPIRFADAMVLPVSGEDGYAFLVRQDDRPEQRMRVDGVVGGGHMVGGGTQGFVSRHADGTVRFLPFDWSRTDGAWFCNTDTRAREGWVPITPAMRLADCGDWPPPRVLGHTDRFSNCQECHGSQIRIGFEPGDGRWVTDYVSLTINCESCHGPGRPHIERVQQAPGSADIGLASLATQDTEASLELCFRCHALKDAVAPGYLPGKDLDEHYAVKFPILGDEPYYADGRIRSFAYQATHLYSACYVRGSMTCVDCHAPHDQSYQDIHGNRLESRFDDGQCLDCHPSKADRIEAHTFHPEGSAGSQCVACHMPYLQHPELGDGVTFARSDHTIPVPRPAFDDSLGIENACSKCHADRSVAALDAQVRDWWGEPRPHPPAVRALIQANRSPPPDLESAATMVLRPESDHAIGQFAGLGFLVERYLEANDTPGPEALERLRSLAGSEDLDVRALALAALHLTAGETPEVRRLLSDALEGAGVRDRALRGRWILALGHVADRHRAAGRTDDAVVVYHKALELKPDDPRILLNLGVAQNAAGRPAAAVESIRRALQIDPTVTLGYVNLGIALQGTGDLRNAVRAFETGIELNPSEPLGYFNLANLYLRQEQPGRAAPLYERALELDPGLALGHLYLGRAYIGLGRLADALPAARNAVQFDPDNESARQMLAQLEQVLTR